MRQLCRREAVLSPIALLGVRTMSTVTIYFEFSNGETTTEDFEGSSGVGDLVSDYADEYIDDNFDLSEEEVELVEYSIAGTDTDYTDEASADDFDDLDAWGEYCDLVDEHGEAFVLRHADWAGYDDSSAMESYYGCWSSPEEYARHFCEEHYGYDNPLFPYVDWEHYARDILMDSSVYEGDEGYHIFSD